MKSFQFFSSKNFFYFSALQRLWLIVWGGKTRKNDKNFSPLWSFLWTFFKTHEIELLRSFSTEFLFHFICSCMLRASSMFFLFISSFFIRWWTKFSHHQDIYSVEFGMREFFAENFFCSSLLFFVLMEFVQLLGSFKILGKWNVQGFKGCMQYWRRWKM